MSNWADTAKRLVQHPNWVWFEGMLPCWVVDGKHEAGSDPDWRIRADSEHGEFNDCYPDLTDFATVGILLGIVVKTGKTFGFQQECDCAGCFWEAYAWDPSYPMGGRPHWCFYGAQNPGQALAELILELWGEP